MRAQNEIRLKNRLILSHYFLVFFFFMITMVYMYDAVFECYLNFASPFIFLEIKIVRAILYHPRFRKLRTIITAVFCFLLFEASRYFVPELSSTDFRTHAVQGGEIFVSLNFFTGHYWTLRASNDKLYTAPLLYTHPAHPPQ